MKKNWLFLTFIVLLFCGCAIEDDSEKNKDSEKTEEEAKIAGTFVYNNNGEVSFDDGEFASDNEDVKFDKKVTITFNGADDPEVTGTDSDNITLAKDKDRGEGKTYLIIRSSVNAEYEVSGNCEDGALLIFSDKKFKLTLNNLTLNSSNWPALNIQSKKRCFFVINGENTLTGPGILNPGESLRNPDYVKGISEDEDEYLDAKATIFSEGELIFKGNGTLNVTGNCKHAICSDDYIRVLGGKINVKGAPTDGIHVNDAMYINGGEIDIVSNSDGIECEKGFVHINGGKLTVKSGKVGIKTSENKYSSSSALIERPFVFIEDGEVSVATSKVEGDGIYARSYLAITGGKVVIETNGVSAKGLVSGSNDDSTLKGEVVIAKDADVEVTVKGNTSGAVAVKSAAGVYMRGGNLKVNAVGSGSIGVSTTDKIIISGGKSNLYAVGETLVAEEVAFEEGADLLAIGSENNCKITSNQKYIEGTVSSDSGFAVETEYEIADRTGKFLTALDSLKILLTQKELEKMPETLKINGENYSSSFELKK